PHLPPAAAHPTSAWGDTVSAGRHPEGGRRSDMRFRTTILQSGKTATGIEVPDEVMEALGSGKRPAVTVTVNGYSYRRTGAAVAGRSMVGLSAEHRAGAGVAGGDEVEVDLELDTAPREVAVPDELAAALDAGAAGRGTCHRASHRHNAR